MARLVRRRESGSSMYPTRGRRESRKKSEKPIAPPLPKFASIRNPASATRNTANTPRIASVLTRGAASLSSFRLFFLSFFFPCLIGIHHTLRQRVFHRKNGESHPLKRPEQRARVLFLRQRRRKCFCLIPRTPTLITDRY